MESKRTLDGNVLFAGNEHAPKYGSKNPISRVLVNNFLASLTRLVAVTGQKNIHEIGCGEGHITALMARSGYTIRGCDISKSSLGVARSELAKQGLSAPLSEKSIYDLEPSTDSADLVICCEVLEHLTDPDAGLKKLVSITKKDLIISVPREPIWHILNMVRGQYLNALGNTPGHFQHWTKNQFIAFASQYTSVVAVRSPLPWTILHCRPK